MDFVAVLIKNMAHIAKENKRTIKYHTYYFGVKNTWTIDRKKWAS